MLELKIGRGRMQGFTGNGRKGKMVCWDQNRLHGAAKI